MLVLLQTLLGAALGSAAGWFVQSVFHWPNAVETGIVCGAAGQACRSSLAWLSRPSEQTRAFQDRVTTPAVLASIALALAACILFLRFPATVVAPAASYLVVRILLSFQNRGSSGGALSRWTLQLAARGGEAVVLLAALLASQSLS